MFKPLILSIVCVSIAEAHHVLGTISILISIGYGAHKWYLLNKNKNNGSEKK